VSAASLVGIALLRATEKTLLRLVAFAAGTFLAGFFLHILPKISGLGESAFLVTLLSFTLFGIIEKFLHFHSHDTRRTIGWMNLLGDFLHNFLDGAAIAAAFKLDPSFGWLVTFMVLAHEVPQELGDYAVLRVSGFSRGKALALNFLTALSAVAGVLAGWFLPLNPLFLLAVAGGTFLYIAASDLIPLLREEVRDWREFWVALLFFFAGIGLMMGLRFLRP